MAHENTCRAFWVQEPGRGVLRTAPLRDPAPGEVVVRTLYSAVSRGTESLVFRGGVPAALHGSMRCPFQEGDFPAPVKYGYMNVGVVEGGEGEAAAALEGRTVFCLHPHQDRYVVPANAVTPVPEGVPAARAVLAANVETAVNGVWDSGAGVGDRVVVVGGGVVGLVAAWIAGGIPGTDVLVVDPEPARRDVARALGVEWTPAPPPGLDADVVLHASGTPEGLTAALAAAGQEAVVAELSWFGDRPVSVPLGGAFHPRRLTLRSSQVGRVPPARAPRWSTDRRLALALDLLREPALDVLVTDESPFEDLPTVMAALAAEAAPTLCHRIAYPGASRITQDQ